MKYRLRMLLAAAFWCGAAWLLWHWAYGSEERRGQTTLWSAQMAEYRAGRDRRIELEFPVPRELAVGDPIFVQSSDGTLRPVGQIAWLQSGDQKLEVRQAQVLQASAQLYPSAPAIGEGAELTYIATPDSLAWVIQTMLPPEKRTQIATELSAAFAEHRGEILAALRPIAEQSLRDALAIIEEDLPPAIARHRTELEAIGARYHEEIVEAEVVPLVQEEVWPIVRRHGEPVAAEVSRELWDRVSLWRFGWRYMYDRSLFPDKNLTEKEFRRFSEEEASPILREHADDFLAAIENSLKDTARNPRVRAALRRNLVKIMEDPELQAVLGDIFREVIVDNPRLREALQRHWTSPQAQEAFQLAAERLEPTVRRMGDLVFGSPKEGISPEFAAVLRNQILHKDRRWLLLQGTGTAASRASDVRQIRVKFASPRASAHRQVLAEQRNAAG